MKIYQIDCSARKKGSASRELAKKLLVKIKKSEDDDDGEEFVGITGYAADGTTKVNINGEDSLSSQHYFTLAGTNVPNDGQYRIYKGYYKAVQI